MFARNTRNKYLTLMVCMRHIGRILNNDFASMRRQLLKSSRPETEFQSQDVTRRHKMSQAFEHPS